MQQIYIYQSCFLLTYWIYLLVLIAFVWSVSGFLDFPGGSDSKESACNAGDPGSVPGLGRSPGEGNGYPLQYTCLENSMDRGASQATIHGVTKNRKWLSISHFHFTFKGKGECVWPVHGLLHGGHPLYTLKGQHNSRMYFLGLPLQLKSIWSAVTYTTPYLKIRITVSLGCMDITGKFHQTLLAMGPKRSIT